MRPARRLAPLALVLVLAACASAGGTGVRDGGGTPAGGAADAGSLADAGAPGDGGTTGDGGAITADGGAITDGGTARDGGGLPDAGTTADAGTAPDAGTPADGGTPTADRETTLVGDLTAGDDMLLRTRPGLVEAKYAAMGADLYTYYRGNAASFAADVRRGTMPAFQTPFGAADIQVASSGDAHFENFGLLLAGDGTFALEPNDLDAADRYPWLWDVQRMTTGLVLAARLSNPGDSAAQATAAAAARDVAAAALTAYDQEIHRLAAGGAPARIDSDGGNPVLADAFTRAARDLANRRELTDDTVVSGTTRTFRLGVLDPAAPDQRQVAVTADDRAAVAATLAEWNAHLATPYPAADLQVLDVVRALGHGVASRPRLRLLVLVRGPTDAVDDDLILELKEETGTPSPTAATFADPQTRIRTLAATLFARADSEPDWGAATYEGLPVQVRAERACEKTLRVHRLVADRGTPAALEGVAAVLGRLLARMHASALPGAQSPAAKIAAAIDADPSAFVPDLADAAVAYADRVTADQALLQDALATKGPRLGFTATDLSVNEVAVDGPDWIELAAGTAGPFVDLTDLAITDSDGAGAPNGAHTVRFPDGLRLAPGGYFLVLAKVASPVAGVTTDCTLAGVPACVQVGFGLSGPSGDGAFVLDQSAGIIASALVPAGAVATGSGLTWGRVPDRTGALGLTQPTPDAANVAAP